ncbi:MAG: type II secretion system F family protein [Gemmatimonadales bacterium]|nr:MAG: type II secretion system F family protein [Gemmatimonadales bacterium]
MIILLVTFVLFLAGMWSAYWYFVVRPEQKASGAALRRLMPRAGSSSKSKSSAVLRKADAPMSGFGALDKILRGSQSQVGGLQVLIVQSGAKVTVGTLLLGCAVLSLLTFLVVWRLSGMAVLGLPVAILVSFIPFSVLKYKRTLRMRKFEEQLPEALDLLTRALRAGHAFTTGIEMVAAEMPKPVGPEFKVLFDEQNFGKPMPDALKGFAERIPVLDARFFVNAVLIQRESGGNLSEVLENLSKVIRERFRIKRQIRVISAHGRITGWILAGLPPALGIVLMTINAEHRRTMFGDPLGIQMMIGAVILQVVGSLIIRKIVDVEY